MLEDVDSENEPPECCDWCGEYPADCHCDDDDDFDRDELGEDPEED